jgi:hypothetical protein
LRVLERNDLPRLQRWLVAHMSYMTAAELARMAPGRGAVPPAG